MPWLTGIFRNPLVGTVAKGGDKLITTFCNSAMRQNLSL